MTALISFRNEYDEVEKTVVSIRATTDNMPIILVNDASDNDYDYEAIADKYNCEYLHNTTPSGVAGARVDGVKLVKTPYFIILDGHMRMWEKDWDKRAVQIMEEYGTDNVYFGRTLSLKDEYETMSLEEIKPHVIKTYGCCIAHEKYTLIPKWAYKPEYIDENDKIVQVPCLLGACYMFSVENWNRLKMLEGLKCWGQDEPLISLKTFLSGNKVLLITDMIFGHLYRKKRPYNTISYEMNSNYIYCNYLFCQNENEYEKLNSFLKHNLTEYHYKLTYNEFYKDIEKTKEMKQYLYDNVFVKTMDEFWEFNNNFYPKSTKELLFKYEEFINNN